MRAPIECRLDSPWRRQKSVDDFEAHEEAVARDGMHLCRIRCAMLGVSVVRGPGLRGTLFMRFIRRALWAMVWLCLLASARGQQSVHFATIWDKSATTAWQARHGLTSAEYQAAFTTLVNQGYRPIYVSGYAVNGVDYYTGVWDKSGGPAWIARHRLTSAEHQAAFTQYVGQGYRPIRISAYTVAGVDYYASIWTKDLTVPTIARHRLNAAQYQAAFNENAALGYRLTDISGYTVNGEAAYAAIWQKPAGVAIPAWTAAHGMTSDQYQAKFVELLNQGYRLRTVSGYEVGGVDRYAAIWDKAPSSAWVARHRVAGANYQALFNEFTSQGYHPLVVSGYVTGAATVPDIASSGVPVPELRVFDDTMKVFMGARNIPAGVLCVSKNGKLLFERAYGWQDKAKTMPLKPSAMFRIASLCKPLTEAAIRKLVEAKQLKLEQFVFDLGQPGGGLLKYTPVGTPDARLKQVTVGHLMDHKGGWNRDLSGDPMFRVVEIAQVVGTPAPASDRDIVRYMMGRPLDHAPGTTYAYSNFGYLLLGLIVEQLAGVDYVEYLHQEVFGPAGVADTEVELGRSLPQFRNEREPWYSDSATARNVFAPGQNVLFPDGGFFLEVMEAHGGLISTARAYSRFLGKFWIDGQPRQGNGQAWTFFGSLPGTWTLGHQRADGVDIVAFFNQRADASGLSYDDILPSLNAAASSVVTWPTTDIADSLKVMPEVKWDREAKTLAIQTTEVGRVYQLESSGELRDWSPMGTPQVGKGSAVRWDLNLGGQEGTTVRFYRVMVE